MDGCILTCLKDFRGLCKACSDSFVQAAQVYTKIISNNPYLVTVGLENCFKLKINHISNYPVQVKLTVLYFMLGVFICFKLTGMLN
jgi:hypothetical protein